MLTLCMYQTVEDRSDDNDETRLRPSVSDVIQVPVISGLWLAFIIQFNWLRATLDLEWQTLGEPDQRWQN